MSPPGHGVADKLPVAAALAEVKPALSELSDDTDGVSDAVASQPDVRPLVFSLTSPHLEGSSSPLTHHTASNATWGVQCFCALCLSFGMYGSNIVCIGPDVAHSRRRNSSTAPAQPANEP